MRVLIFDLDCTILYHTNRSPFDWSDLSGDKPIPAVKDLLATLECDYELIIITGRPESVRPQTIEWLETNGIFYDQLIMKDENPYEKGSAFKERALKSIPDWETRVLIAFDDDLDCAEMYRNNGIISMLPINYKYRDLVEIKDTQTTWFK